MEKQMDIVALGELLIDFTEAGQSDSGKKLFERNPGGAPANMLTAASHLGCSTAFIGKVGADMHGSFLIDTLQSENINTRAIVEDLHCFTTLAFVEIDAGGERRFSFARKPGADAMLRPDELDRELLENCQIFHFGSLSLTNQPARSATLKAIEIAKRAGALISYDPNYRASLWDSPAAALEQMLPVILLADVMKVSDEESLLLTGKTDYLEAAQALLNKGLKFVAVTLGSKGVLIASRDRHELLDAFPVQAVDTTGAGDSFWGGFLGTFLSYHQDIADMDWESLKHCALVGNATAGLCVQKRGGILSIPTATEIKEFMAINKFVQ